MTIELLKFKPQPNIDILNYVRKNASTDYNRRIPEATKANIQNTVQKMLDYRPTQNEFIDTLVNQIGLILYKNITWQNPLAKFKRGMLEFGDTIEEINVGLIQAKVYDTSRDALEGEIFGTHASDVQTSFHKVNRMNYYPLTINDALLKRAFLSEFGLSEMLTSLMNSPSTSDNYDEFLLTTSLFAEYHNAGGFFKVQIADIGAATSDEADAKFALRRLREFAEILKFPSVHYNASGMPVAAGEDELELFLTPEAAAALDVEALAGAFNIDKAQMPGRITVIPKEYFNIPGAQGILTTRDFFVIADEKIESTSVMNPVTLQTNYFLHHWQVVSASRFVPALLLTTEAGDSIVVQETPVTAVVTPTLTDGDGTVVTTVARGERYQVVSSATTTPAGGANDAVRFELLGNLSPRTYLYQTGVLTVALDEDATDLRINVYAVDGGISATFNPTVVGDKVQIWPNANITPDADDDGLFEVTPDAVPAAPTSGANKNKVAIPTVVGVDYKDGATTVSGTTITLTANKTITAVAQAHYEIKAGAVTSWPLVFTA